jgi:hypothetical protein
VYKARIVLDINAARTQQLAEGQRIIVNPALNEDPSSNDFNTWTGGFEITQTSLLVTVAFGEPLILSGGRGWGLPSGVDVVAFVRSTAAVPPRSSSGVMNITSANWGGASSGSITLPFQFNGLSMVTMNIGSGKNDVLGMVWKVSDGDGMPLLKPDLTPYASTEIEVAGQYTFFIDGRTTPVEDIIIEGVNVTEQQGIAVGYITSIDGFNGDEINARPGEIVTIGGNPSIVLHDNISIADGFIITQEDGTQTDEQRLLTSSIIARMMELDPDGMFNWAYKVLDHDKVRQPTLSANYWDRNHIANQYTIAKLNTDRTRRTLRINPANIEGR